MRSIYVGFTCLYGRFHVHACEDFESGEGELIGLFFGFRGYSCEKEGGEGESVGHWWVEGKREIGMRVKDHIQQRLVQAGCKIPWLRIHAG